MKHIFILFLSLIVSELANSRSNAEIPIFGGYTSFRYSLINHPPFGANKTIASLEDIAYPFTVPDFGFIDPNDEPQNEFLAVKITTLPSNGSLKLAGINVTVGQFISVTDIISGAFTYTPLLNANGNAYTTFTFQVQDDGGVANGGVDLDQIPNTFTFNVTAVNDAPVFLIGASQAVCKNSAAEIVPSWCTMISDGDPEVSQSVSFVVTNDNNALFSVQPAVTPVGQLSYTPAPNMIGIAVVSVKITDSGGTSNGGINQSAIQTALIHLKPGSGWVGKISADWFNTSNWCEAVPVATTDAIIYPASFQPLITGANAVCSDLTLVSGSTLTIVAPNLLNVTGD